MNDIKSRLQRGEVIYGTHVFAGMPMLTEAMAECGFDLLWIDMEHTSIRAEQLVNNLIAAKADIFPERYSKMRLEEFPNSKTRLYRVGNRMYGKLLLCHTAFTAEL